MCDDKDHSVSIQRSSLDRTGNEAARKSIADYRERAFARAAMTSQSRKAASDMPTVGEATVDNLAHTYGITLEEARQLIRDHGHDRLKLEAAAGQLKARRR